MHIWVIDTSSILDLRRSIVTGHSLKAVFTELDYWVYRGALVFPSQVVGELGRHTETIQRKAGADPCFNWAKKNEAKATRHGLMFERARAVLERVPNLVDADKVSVGGVDVADPYVIALALAIQAEGDIPTIITEDFNTTPYHTGLADAAGLFRVPTVRVRTFLKDEEIWPLPGAPQ